MPPSSSNQHHYPSGGYGGYDNYRSGNSSYHNEAAAAASAASAAGGRGADNYSETSHNRDSWADANQTMDRNSYDYTYDYGHREEPSSPTTVAGGFPRQNDRYSNADPDATYVTNNLAHGGSTAQPYPATAGHEFDEKNNTDMADATTRSAPFGFASYDAGNDNAMLTNRYANRSSRSHAKHDSIFSQDDHYVYRRRSVPVRCFRTLACLIIWTILLIVSVILLIVTFAEPPNVALVSIETPTASDFTITTSAFSANGSVNFAISNPNSFSATIEHIVANLYDADLTDKISVGNGSLTDQVLAAHSNTSVTFPFDVSVDLTSGATALIEDIEDKCGYTTSSSRRRRRRREAESARLGGDSNHLSMRDVRAFSNLAVREGDALLPHPASFQHLVHRATGSISVLLDLEIKIKILSLPISLPTISSTLSIDCPSESSIESIISDL